LVWQIDRDSFERVLSQFEYGIKIQKLLMYEKLLHFKSMFYYFNLIYTWVHVSNFL
jgi:hypothetical protein